MLKNKLTGFLYYFFISGLMIPFFLSLVPSVKLMKDLHLMDTLNGISLSYIGRNVAFAVFLFMGFIRTIPKEIGESAIVDGCRPFKLYWYIYFPMLKPVVTTLVILNAMSIWNDFLFPLLVLQSNANRTLTLVQYIFRSEANTQWNLVFASYLLSMLPLMILYFALQKNIVEGIAAGAVKG
jgi:raffinose/stachyose/melibiose transport system permease protein